MQRIYSKRKYTCTFASCKRSFDRPYRLAQHQLIHLDVRPFVCSVENCTKAYSCKSHLDRHFNVVHKQKEFVTLFCCPVCFKKYSNRQNLKRHWKTNHENNEQSFICDICRLVFRKKHQLAEHMYQHTGIMPLSCPLCDKQFIRMRDKKKHLSNHKNHKCEHCFANFNRWSELLAHKRNDHGSPEYICNDCNSVFKLRSHILRHVKRHEAEKNFTMFFCPYKNCNRYYSRNSNLKQHILTKHEGRTFDCTVCGAGLSSKAKLNEHIERHTKPPTMLKVPKTLSTGRKKRKDACSVKISSALKLAGLVAVEILDKPEEQDTAPDNNRHNVAALATIEMLNDPPKEQKSAPKKNRHNVAALATVEMVNDSPEEQDTARDKIRHNVAALATVEKSNDIPKGQDTTRHKNRRDVAALARVDMLNRSPEDTDAVSDHNQLNVAALVNVGMVNNSPEEKETSDNKMLNDTYNKMT